MLGIHLLNHVGLTKLRSARKFSSQSSRMLTSLLLFRGCGYGCFKIVARLDKPGPIIGRKYASSEAKSKFIAEQVDIGYASFDREPSSRHCRLQVHAVGSVSASHAQKRGGSSLSEEPWVKVGWGRHYYREFAVQVVNKRTRGSNLKLIRKCTCNGGAVVFKSNREPAVRYHGSLATGGEPYVRKQVDFLNANAGRAGDLQGVPHQPSLSFVQYDLPDSGSRQHDGEDSDYPIRPVGSTVARRGIVGCGLAALLLPAAWFSDELIRQRRRAVGLSLICSVIAVFAPSVLLLALTGFRWAWGWRL